MEQCPLVGTPFFLGEAEIEEISISKTPTITAFTEDTSLDFETWALLD